MKPSLAKKYFPTSDVKNIFPAFSNQNFTQIIIISHLFIKAIHWLKSMPICNKNKRQVYIIKLWVFLAKHLTLKKNFTGPFYGWGSTASRPELLTSQKFLVLIISISEGWKAESRLEPPSGFEHGTPGLGIQRLNHYAIAPKLSRT